MVTGWTWKHSDDKQPTIPKILTRQCVFFSLLDSSLHNEPEEPTARNRWMGLKLRNGWFKCKASGKLSIHLQEDLQNVPSIK